MTFWRHPLAGVNQTHFSLYLHKKTPFCAIMGLTAYPGSKKIFMTYSFKDHSFSDSFFKPLFEVYETSNFQYNCTGISDIEYLMMGAHRIISSEQSGNGFLQNFKMTNDEHVSVGHFFQAIKSPRRLNNQKSVNSRLNAYLADHLEDPLSEVAELKNWHLYAGDGHYHKAAIFDEATQSKDPDKEPRKSATGHFFTVNMRTHHMGYLDLAQPEDGKKSEHDLKALKRQDTETLRAHAPKGHQVLYVWDRACIDYPFWHQMKHNKGVYFCTLAKSNSHTKKIRNHQLIDYQDKRNEGVLSDDLVETSQGYEIRKIVYTNPADGKTYTDLTNEFSLPAWVHVLLYKHRWDIEKIFHQFKSKLHETRSWSSDKNGKQAHALFLCIVHNLMLLCENQASEEGLSDLIESKKAEIRERTRPIPEGQGWRRKHVSSFINKFFKRASQRTCRFIRWLREALDKRSPYLLAMDDLRRVWGC